VQKKGRSVAVPMKAVVTGALNYSGQHIARRLLEEGHQVTTLTHSQHRPNPFGDAIRIRPFRFDSPEEMARLLQGTDVLFNTYWIRYNHKRFTFDDALANSEILINAARDAGVDRIVHISITNPSPSSPLPYFKGKALVEEMIKSSGVSYAVLRPAVLFGGHGVLINNIAWMLRHLPVFGLPGDGRYRVQPIHVEDLARLMVEASKSSENTTTDAIGPETFQYKDLVQTIAAILGKRRLVVGVPPGVAYGSAYLLGKLLGDVILTWDEIRGLMSDVLYVDSPPVGTIALSDWARKNKDLLGRRYVNDLKKRLVRS